MKIRRFSAEAVHSSEVKYFLGYESVGKPTQGMKILGVFGVQPYDELLQYAHTHQVQGILLGANKSFWPSNPTTDDQWHALILYLLSSTDYKIIFSISANDLGIFDLSRYYQYGRFYLQVYITSPGLEKCPPDTTLIIEDRSWEQNNRCLYTFDLGSIIQGKNAVAWDDISADVVVEKFINNALDSPS